MSAALVKAYQAVGAAKELLYADLRTDYPPGAPVSWVRGCLNFGAVIQHGFADRIQVCNSKTKAKYWIRAFEIVFADGLVQQAAE